MIGDENEDGVLEPLGLGGRLHELPETPVGVIERVEKAILAGPVVGALFEARGQPRKRLVRGPGINVSEERFLGPRELAGKKHERVVIPPESRGIGVRIIKYERNILHSIIFLEPGGLRDRIHAEGTAPGALDKNRAITVARGDRAEP